MTKPHTFSFLTRVDRDLQTRPSVQERVLNEAIVRADISAGFEEYLEIFDTFYAEDVEVSSGIGQEAIRGKTSVRSLLIETGQASAALKMETDPAVHGNPMGTVHGGVLRDIADAAIGTAHATTLDAK